MTEFHFIRPLWLAALIVLFFALWLLKKYRVKHSSWQSILPAHLAKVLITESKSQKPFSLWLPAIIGSLAITALAGPTWQKLPQPVYQVARGSVLIMDLSYSMYATDITPNRLTRARFKAIDLLDEINEGEIGLVAYAGDAFTISPLTEDINNIKLLLPSLAPELMPELGSNPLAALALSAEMLKNAGHLDGDIYWFTDGIEHDDIQDITQWSRGNNYRVNILGVGTAQGAPIKLNTGELMKGNDGAIVLPKLPEQRLSGIANRARGQYQSISHTADDIKRLVNASLLAIDSAKNNNQKSENSVAAKSDDNSFGDQWHDMGPYLLLPLLALLLTYFRKGSLLSMSSIALFMISSSAVLPPPAHAFQWQDLWQTKAQQGQEKFNQQRYQEAADDFNDPLWKGSAHYKAGNFEQALQAFKKSNSAEALYNQGNALAKLQQFDEAIAAFDEALTKQPNLVEAQQNKALVEAIKKQQEQQQNQQNGEDGENSESEQNQQQDQKNGEDGDNSESDQNQQQGQQNEQTDGNDAQNSQQQNSQPEQSQNGEESHDNSDEQSDELENKKSADNDREEKDAQSQESEAEASNSKQENEQEAEQKNKQSDEQISEAMPASEEDEAPSTKAQQIAAKLAQEKELKHQQILNKVTDDPYLLLRNKMQREYKKRRLTQSTRGDQKKW